MSCGPAASRNSSSTRSVRSVRTPSQPATASSSSARGGGRSSGQIVASRRRADRVEPVLRDDAARRRPWSVRAHRAAPVIAPRRRSRLRRQPVDERPGSARAPSSGSRASSRTRSGCGWSRPRRTPSRRGRRRRPRAAAGPPAPPRSGPCRRSPGRRRTRPSGGGSGCPGSSLRPVDDEVAPGAELDDHRRRSASCGPRSASTAPTWANVGAQLIVLMMSWPYVWIERRRHDRVAEPPAGHRERLREAVEHDRPLGHAGQRRDRDVLLAVVQDPAVDLVGQDDQVVPDRQLGDRARDRARVRTPPVGLAGELMTSIRVRGRDERRELVEVDAEVVLHPDRDRDRRRRRRIGSSTRRSGSPGSGTMTSSPGSIEAEDRVEHHALAADGDEHAIRRDVEALAGGGVLGDRLAQGRDARGTGA